MKTIVRRVALYSFILFLLPQIVPGVHITGGFLTLIIGGIGLALMFMILKPILNIISFPINLATLGLFSMFTNALILYLLTIFITGVSLSPFSYDPINYLGFTTPQISFNLFFAYVYAALIVSLIESFLSWLMN